MSAKTGKMDIAYEVRPPSYHMQECAAAIPPLGMLPGSVVFWYCLV